VNLNERVEDRVNQGLLGQWYVVAKSADIAQGTPVAVQALGRALVLWRAANSQLCCIEDRCPHRGARLSLGRIFGNDISCRYHGVTLDRAGSIVSVPAMGRCGLEGRAAVPSYAVQEWRDGVFVYFPSAEYPQPRPMTLPSEIKDDAYASFLCTALWECNYRYVVENLVDPMHGVYLHGDTFTLGNGAKQDRIELHATEHGFIVQRAGQQGVNFDWVEMVLEDSLMYARVLIPYPPAGGPGGHMHVIASVTPVDAHRSRIFFWRTRKVQGVERELWRFLFRTTFEARHWYVLEQDRLMLSSLPDDARSRELLYQHDGGVARIRTGLARRARRQLELESAVSEVYLI